MTPKDDVRGGRFYGRTRDGRLVPVPDDIGRQPDLWICRRVVDFPAQVVPAGGAVAACTRCGAALVFNPARQVTAPKVCMQCAQIEPLPYDGTPGRII